MKDQGMIGSLKDPVLQKIRTEIEAKIQPDLKDAYLRIVVAGMKIMFSPQTHQMAVKALTEAAKKSGPYNAVALGTVTLIKIIQRESKGKMSMPAAFPAAIVLMCYAFEFVEKMQNLTVTPEVIAQATRVVTSGLMRLFGITKEKLAEGIEYARKNQGGMVGTSPGAPPPPPAVPATPGVPA